MKPAMKQRGLFIVFEGLDGCGKTTQMERLRQHLSERGVPCAAHREPTDGPVGRVIRQAIQKEICLAEETLALLFAADRYEHALALKKLLAAGQTVLCDRYLFSSLAYQSVSLSMETVRGYNRAAEALLLPDLTVFLDVSPEACMHRITANRPQTDLFETTARLQKVRAGFYRAFDLLENKAPVLRVDGGQSMDEVFADILKGLQRMVSF